MNILGTHSFPTFIHHKECQHGPLPAIDRKPYMEPGSLALKKVSEAVLGAHQHNFDDLEHYSEFVQTGPNESLNSVTTLKYLEKSVSYSWEMTWCRSVLGALDLNLSGGKQIARRRDGQERFKTQRGRSSKKWVARPIYEAKNYSWKFEIMEKIREAASRGVVPAVGPPNTKEEEAALRPMCDQLKADLVSQHQSRMNKIRNIGDSLQESS